jgi:hypothetical protein
MVARPLSLALGAPLLLCGCLLERDLVTRPEQVPPARAPARARPAVAARAPVDPAQWTNPYLAAASSTVEGGASGPAPYAEEEAPAAPLTAAQAAAALDEDGGEDADEGPPPPGTAEAAALAADQLPPAGGEVDPALFQARLSPYGRWVDTPDAGAVFIPSDLPSGWRPYWNGRWIYTGWGWSFASDDPWGWAAWHYGRWAFGVGFGWYWIPGRVWAPAWVSWRWGHGWACWAPYGSGWGFASPAWVVVRARHFTHPISSAALPPGRGLGPIAHASPLAAGARGPLGPARTEVEHAVGHPVAQRTVASALRPHAFPRPRVTGIGPMQPAGSQAARPTPPGQMRPPIPHTGTRAPAPPGRGISSVPGKARPQLSTPPVARPLQNRRAGSGAHSGDQGQRRGDQGHAGSVSSPPRSGQGHAGVASRPSGSGYSGGGGKGSRGKGR